MTCYLLPQQEYKPKSPAEENQEDSDSENWKSRDNNSRVKFSEDSESEREQTPFVRQNTPHPKELKLKAHKLFAKEKSKQEELETLSEEPSSGKTIADSGTMDNLAESQIETFSTVTVTGQQQPINSISQEPIAEVNENRDSEIFDEVGDLERRVGFKEEVKEEYDEELEAEMDEQAKKLSKLQRKYVSIFFLIFFFYRKLIFCFFFFILETHLIT